MICAHETTYDFTGGGSYEIEWCRSCGAIRKTKWDETRGRVWSEWELPSGAVRPWKFGIMHPSDRALSIRFFDKAEMWGGDEPLLFDTEEAAKAHIAKRLRKYPDSDWVQARILRCRPGQPETFAEWEWVPQKVAANV